MEFFLPLLPEALRGRKRQDDRRVLNGIVWKFRTDSAARRLPTGGRHHLRTPWTEGSRAGRLGKDLRDEAMTAGTVPATS